MRRYRERKSGMWLVSVRVPDNAAGSRALPAKVPTRRTSAAALTSHSARERLPAPPAGKSRLEEIFASETENCPNILLEALAAGRPVVCSNRPPMPEFGAGAVLYFDPSSPEQLAGQLLEIIDDPALQARLAAKAVERAELYDWRQTARLTWSAIEDLHRQQAPR